MVAPRVDIPEAKIAEFCKRWMIAELSIFGSVLRDDFGADSDVDVLVSFQPGAKWSYWDWPAMQDELSAIFGGRPVDLVEREAVSNPFRRSRILSSRRVLYAA